MAEEIEELAKFYNELKPSIFKKFEDKSFKENLVEWIECSKLDINAAKEIKKYYTNKADNNQFLIALAVFHLQQAVEKVTKVFSYIIVKPEHSAEKTVRESGHTSVLALVSALLSIKDILPTYYVNLLIKLEEQLKDPLGKEGIIGNDDFVRLNREQIRELINRFDTAAPNNSVTFKISGESDVAIHRIVIELVQILPLALITFPHWSFSRYPNGRVKPSNYNELGITQCIDELISKTEIIINNLNFKNFVLF
ncbi:hypothetical protein M1585_04810 [Candidatus Parvarchaeota archaeon]|nr:hypothetical protein [Candidatus Parvarchaeota archaeon]